MAIKINEEKINIGSCNQCSKLNYISDVMKNKHNYVLYKLSVSSKNSNQFMSMTLCEECLKLLKQKINECLEGD